MQVTEQNNRWIAWLAFGLMTFLLSGCSGNGQSGPAAVTPTSAVTVRVVASDADGDTLHYRWAATQGAIVNVDSPTTTWTPPVGSGVAGKQGLHFIYVLVSDDKGGYTERRVGVLAQTTVPSGARTAISIPAASGSAGHIWGTLFYRGNYKRNVYVTNAKVTVLQNSGPVIVAETFTNFKGEFYLSNIAPGAYTIKYEVFDGITANAAAPGSGALIATGQVAHNVVAFAESNQASPPTSPSSESYIKIPIDSAVSARNRVAGHVLLGDDGYCGIRNEFFTNPADANMLTGPRSAVAELLNKTTGAFLASTHVNHFGDFLLINPTSAASKVRVRCEQANDFEADTPPGVESHFASNIIIQTQKNGSAVSNNRPTISDLVVTLGNDNISRPDVPASTKLIAEMANAPGDDNFLSYKGLDTRKSACAYYRSLGAVEGCDANGFPTGAKLSYDEWLSRNKLGTYRQNNVEITAAFINKTDLNLGRDMHATRLADDHLAYVVCNYPGPLSTVGDGRPVPIGSETQVEISESLDKMRKGLGLIACVAMEYSVTLGVNGDKPFTKFYTFGPSGELLLSISLDGRREKFVPGSCVACHGGDTYGGRFPDDGSGRPDIGSYFLPFDIDNYYFASATDKTAQKPAIDALNSMLNSVPSAIGAPRLPVTSDAVNVILRLVAPVPNDLSVAYGAAEQTRCKSCHASYSAAQVYADSVRPNCRICHLSNAHGLVQTQNGILRADRSTPNPISPRPRITFEQYPPSHYRKYEAICGGGAELERNHTMPNTLIAYERMWLEAGNANSVLAKLFAFNTEPGEVLVNDLCKNAAGGVPEASPPLK